MENINLNNIGTANLILTSILVKSYINENFNDDNKNLLKEFYNLINESPILELELKVINNIENKSIKDNTLAMRYIDDNIKLFELYTIDDVKNERNKIKQILNNIDDNNIIIDNEKIKLYEYIETLIDESLKYGDDVNVDALHESFEFVLNYLNNNENVNDVKTSNILKNINEDVINIAINKFNDKYSKILKEDDLMFFKKIVKSSLNDKKQIFEEYKNDNLNILKDLNLKTSNKKIEETVNKIKNMKFNPNTINSDLIKLYDLKLNL